MESDQSRTLSIALFAVLGLVVFATLTLTLLSQPLFSFATNDLEWLQAWLYMTVLDYYGVCVPFCAVIFANEETVLASLLWSGACLFLGSPFCCLWMVLRLRAMDVRLPYRYPR